MTCWGAYGDSGTQQRRKAMKMEVFRPELPSFDNLEQERLHIKQRLAAAFRLFSKFGFDEGVAGHITARDPEHKDCFSVNPYATPFSHISVPARRSC